MFVTKPSDFFLVAFCCLTFHRIHLSVSAASPTSQRWPEDQWGSERLAWTRTCRVGVHVSPDLPEVRRAVWAASIFIFISRVLHALFVLLAPPARALLFTSNFVLATAAVWRSKMSDVYRNEQTAFVRTEISDFDFTLASICEVKFLHLFRRNNKNLLLYVNTLNAWIVYIRKTWW